MKTFFEHICVWWDYSIFKMIENLTQPTKPNVLQKYKKLYQLQKQIWLFIIFNENVFWNMFSCIRCVFTMKNVSKHWESTEEVQKQLQYISFAQSVYIYDIFLGIFIQPA